MIGQYSTSRCETRVSSRACLWLAGERAEILARRAATEAALADAEDRDALLAKADEILGDMSWDHTWSLMKEKMQCAI